MELVQAKLQAIKLDGSSQTQGTSSSSIGRLPDELLEEIFLNFEDVDIAHFFYKETTASVYPKPSFTSISISTRSGRAGNPTLSIFDNVKAELDASSHPATRVCHRWRTISMSSQFNSSIYLSYHTNDSDSAPLISEIAGDLERLWQWIPVTGSRTLTIICSSPTSQSIPNNEIINQWPPESTKRIAYLHYLAWRSTSSPVPYPLSLFFPSSAEGFTWDGLEHLSLSFTDHNGPLLGRQSDPLILPILTKLEIHNWCNFPAYLKCPNLRQLDLYMHRSNLTPENARECADFLGSSPRLKTLKLDFRWIGTPSIRALRVLAIVFQTTINLSDAFSLLLQCPNVDTFHLEYPTIIADLTYSSGIEASNVTTLSIMISTRFSISPDFLASFPNLERCGLVLSVPFYTLDILQKIADDATHSLLSSLCRVTEALIPRSERSVARFRNLKLLHLQGIPCDHMAITNIMETYEACENRAGILKLTWETPFGWVPQVNVSSIGLDDFRGKLAQMNIYSKI
jgi:hypothetical protein